MKTTVDIPDDLYGRASKLAEARGQEVAALITEGLQKLLGAQPSRPGNGKNGNSRPAVLPPKAARWLTEWRALGQQNRAKGTQVPSAADVVSRMRR